MITFIWFTEVKLFITLVSLSAGNQGNRWIRAQYGISANSGQFQIVFEGITANGYQGDIAIDDVNVKAGSCGSSNTGLCRNKFI